MDDIKKANVKITTIVVGCLETNCYLLYDDKRDALIIDPGSNPETILLEIDRNYCKPRRILITHSHSDHIGGLEGLLRTYNVPALMHRKELEFLRIPSHKIRRFANDGSTEPGFRSLEDGDEIDMSGWKLTVVFTPGHTPGGACYLMGGGIFTGDTLFCDGVGRTDFEGGSETQLMSSIKNRLLTLDDSVKIYPGHGPSSAIGRERQYF